MAADFPLQAGDRIAKEYLKANAIYLRWPTVNGEGMPTGAFESFLFMRSSPLPPEAVIQLLHPKYVDGWSQGELMCCKIINNIQEFEKDYAPSIASLHPDATKRMYADLTATRAAILQETCGQTVVTDEQANAVEEKLESTHEFAGEFFCTDIREQSSGKMEEEDFVRIESVEQVWPDMPRTYPIQKMILDILNGKKTDLLLIAEHASAKT